jgi:nucleotide-binding universal stress UspA family protein
MSAASFGWRSDVYERVVVPLDGSELAERILPLAEILAWLAGVPVHLVRVADAAGMASPDAGAARHAALAAEDREATDYLAAVRRRLTEQGVAATTEVVRGALPGDLVARLRPGDFVVVASHGRGGRLERPFGRVAGELLGRAPVPVVLVRVTAPAPEAEGGDRRPGGRP